MKLYLIDGYGFVFRAFHSMPPLSRPDGTPIGAVYGFTNMLYKFLSNHEADMIAVALDSGRKTFRNDIYPEYKANRPPPPEELVVQFPIIREVIEAFNVKPLEKIGFEADDLIATYAKLATEAGHEVKIISSDKDLMQLVGNGVTMFDAMKEKDIAEPEVEDKFGVKPDQVLDTLALIGDSSDNVPGVRGIGQKTAAELINEFETLDGIYENIDKISQVRRKQLLEEGKELAYLSKKLITLDDAVTVDDKLEALAVKELDKEKLAAFLQEQGFKSLVAKLGVEAPASTSKAPAPKVESIKFKDIQDLKELEKLIPQIEKNGIISIHVQEGEFSFSSKDLHYKINFNAPEKQESLFDDEQDNKMTSAAAAKILKPLLESEAVKVICEDCKAHIKRLASIGVQLKAYDDISVIAYALDTGKHGYDFKDLALIYLEKEPEGNSFEVYQIYKALERRMFEDKQFALYEAIERPMIQALADIELRGVKLDGEFLHKLSEEFKKKLQKLEEKIYDLAGGEFNIGSPKQMGEVLFDKLAIPGGKKSKSGAYSTGAEVLDKLAEDGHEIAEKILQWRGFSKLISTYTDALPKSINPKTGRVHTTFMMTNTATGRLSSTDPNLQNIPIRTEDGARIREAFIADKGNVIISADYSQIELRLLADIANIDSLKEALAKGHDIHATTASQMFGVPIEEVDSNLRRQAKTINFGIIYGISAFGLARRLDISRGDAKTYIEAYFKQYPGIKEYMDKAIEEAKTHGFVKTLWGRKCHIKGINDKNYALRGFAERAAINAPLQGTAADIIKKAMVKMPADISKHMILQIHDELLFEVPAEKAETYMKKIKKVMEGIIQISVPLEVDVSSGKSWADAH